MEFINIVDVEIGHVAVVAKLAGGGHVWAAAEHEGDPACATEAPIPGGDVIEFTAEYIAIPRTGLVQVMNGENRIRPRDPHRRILACVVRRRGLERLAARAERIAALALTLQAAIRHCPADGGRADIFDLAMALTKEYGLAARVWLDDGRRKAREQGKPVVDNTFLDSYSASLDDKAETYARMLRDLPPGLSEWAVHPAHGNEQRQTIEPTGWQIRRSDHAFLTSPQAREILDHESITVIDYRTLQQAWNA